MNEARNKIKIIYIAGAGRSGSTLLNLLLGASPQCFSIGEVARLAYWYYENFPKPCEGHNYLCDCGMKLKKCEFWSGIDKTVDLQKLFPFFGSLAEKIKITGSIIFQSKINFKQQYCDGDLYHEILKKARKIKGEKVECIIDSSKDLRRMVYLSTLKNIDLTIIHLIRDGRGVIYSREKDKDFWLNSFFVWLTTNFLISRFLESNKNKLKYLRLSYDKFAQSPAKYLEKIAEDLGIDLKIDGIIDAVNNEQYHNFSGNRMRLKKIEAVKYSRPWDEKMPRWKRVVLAALTFIFNNFWVYNDDLH